MSMALLFAIIIGIGLYMNREKATVVSSKVVEGDPFAIFVVPLSHILAYYNPAGFRDPLQTQRGILSARRDSLAMVPHPPKESTPRAYAKNPDHPALVDSI